MPISFNGNSPQNITFNGNQVDKVVYNGDVVWEKSVPQTYTVNYSNLSSSNGYITYNDVKKTGSGSFTVNDGDMIYCYVGGNTGSSYNHGSAIIRLNGNNVSYKVVHAKNTNCYTSYNYYPSSNCTISYERRTGGGSDPTVNWIIGITT